MYFLVVIVLYILFISYLKKNPPEYHVHFVFTFSLVKTSVDVLLSFKLLLFLDKIL